MDLLDSAWDGDKRTFLFSCIPGVKVKDGLGVQYIMVHGTKETTCTMS